MKTMTRPSAGANPPAAGFEFRQIRQPQVADHPGWSSQVLKVLCSAWGLVALSVATVAIIEPTYLPWLLLPAVPATLLAFAGGQGGPSFGRHVMGIFSVATLAAVLFQLIAAPPSKPVFVAVTLATLVFLGATERLVMGTRRGAI